MQYDTVIIIFRFYISSIHIKLDAPLLNNTNPYVGKVGGQLFLSYNDLPMRLLSLARLRLCRRYMAKVLLCPFYRFEWLAAQDPDDASEPQEAARIGAAIQSVGVAYEAVTQLLGQQCRHIIEAIIAKYVALHREELEEVRPVFRVRVRARVR